MTTAPVGAPDALQVAEPTIVIDNLSKWFGQKVAVSEVTCSFGPGVTGLLGPNGAGKTTMMRVVVGLMSPSTGAVTVLGRSPRRDPRVYRDIGFVPEDEAVYQHMSATEFVRWSASLSGVSDPSAAARATLATVELTGDAHRPLGTFSKGMRQRAKVAAALTHDPDVLLLDEPLNGADPVQRAKLIALFRTLAEQGRTIIVSSHVLGEVERMADRVVAMVDGRLAAAGTVAALRNAMSDTPRRVKIETDRPRALAARLIQGAWIERAEVTGDAVVVGTVDALALGRDIPTAATEVDARIVAVVPEDDSLESVFRYLVGET